MSKEISYYTNNAVKIDGKYIEELIDGYTTLSSSGRESLEIQFETLSVGVADGETIKSKRYPARVLTVEFLIEGGNLNEKMEHLSNILSADESDFVFNDESDKFFTGMAIAPNEIERGNGWVTGRYQIYCADPFKYSVDPITVEAIPISGAHAAQFNIDYKGTYPAKPILRAEFAGAQAGGDYSADGDCGFVAFMDSNENIIQLGNPDAVDIDDYAMADQLINRLFSTVSDWEVTGGHSYGGKAVTGLVAPANITDAYWNKGAGQTLQFAKPAYGSGSGWHGPILWKHTAGALNFEVNIVHRMCVNASGEIGTFECCAYSGSKIVAGIVIEKTANGTSGTVKYIVNGEIKATQAVDLSYYNVNFGYCKRTPIYQTQYYNKKTKKWSTKQASKKKYRGGTMKTTVGYTYSQSNLNTSIKKSDNTVEFSVGNLPKKTIVEAGIDMIAADDVSFHFGASGSNPVLNTNAVSSVKFTRNPSGNFADIPNVFTAGDVVEADTSDATVYLMRKNTIEGDPAPQYGALGNDWEDFMLVKGTNNIQAVWSSWVNNNYKPVLKIIYNEVFI